MKGTKQLKIIVTTAIGNVKQILGSVGEKVKGIGTAAAETADKLEDSNKRAADSFSLIDNAATKVKLAIVAVVAAIGSAIAAIISWTKASAIQERAETKLSTTLRTLTGATNDQVKALKDQAAALQQLTGYADEQIISAQAMLATFRLTAAQIGELTPRLLDMAEASRKAGRAEVDLEQISIALGKTFVTGIGSLGEYGVAMSEAEKESFKLANTQEKLQILTSVLDNNFGGLAVAVGHTYEGALRKVDAAHGDFLETLGSLFSGNKAFLNLTTFIGNAWQKLSEGIKGCAGEIGTVITALSGTVTVAFNAIRASWNAFQVAFKTGAVVITTGLEYIVKSLSFITFGELSRGYAKLADDIEAYTAELKKGIIADFGEIADSIKSVGTAFGPPEQKEAPPAQINRIDDGLLKEDKEAEAEFWAYIKAKEEEAAEDLKKVLASREDAYRQHYTNLKSIKANDQKTIAEEFTSAVDELASDRKNAPRSIRDAVGIQMQSAQELSSGDFNAAIESARRGIELLRELKAEGETSTAALWDMATIFKDIANSAARGKAESQLVDTTAAQADIDQLRSKLAELEENGTDRVIKFKAILDEGALAAQVAAVAQKASAAAPPVVIRIAAAAGGGNEPIFTDGTDSFEKAISDEVSATGFK